MPWRGGCCAEHDPEKWDPVFGQDHAQRIDSYIFMLGMLSPSIATTAPSSAPTIAKMIEMMITAGIDANAHLMMIATMRQNGMSISAIDTRCGAAGG